jgi:DNA replication licensing factor MCM5
VTPSQAKLKFVDFLRNFRSAPDANAVDGRLKYRDALDQVNLPKDVKICFDDLIAHDGELARELRMKPNEYLPILEEAVVEVAESVRPNEEDVNEDMDEEEFRQHKARRPSIQVKLTSREIPRALRSLNSGDVNTLVYVPGIVIATVEGAYQGEGNGARVQDVQEHDGAQREPGLQRCEHPETLCGGAFSRHAGGSREEPVRC